MFKLYLVRKSLKTTDRMTKKDNILYIMYNSNFKYLKH